MAFNYDNALFFGVLEYAVTTPCAHLFPPIPLNQSYRISNLGHILASNQQRFACVLYRSHQVGRIDA